MVWTDRQDQEIVELFKEQKNYSKDSEDYLRIRNRILTKLTEGLQSVFTTYIRLWKRKHGIEESDSESLLYENLFIAVNTYNVDRGYDKFIPFFWRTNTCMFKNYLIKIFAQKRVPQVYGINKETNEAVKTFLPVYSIHTKAPNQTEFEDYPETLENLLPDLNSFESQREAAQLLRWVYSRCGRVQKRILKRLFFGYTYKEISQKLHVSPPQIQGVISRLRKKYQHLI